MVEWKKLGDFSQLQKTRNKKHVTENAYSITQAGLVPTKCFFKEKTNITSSDTSGYYIVMKDWFVYSPSRIDVGSISYLKGEGPVIVSPIDVVFSIDTAVCTPDYLLNYFFTYDGKKKLLRNREGVEGMGRRNLPFDAIKNILIPIPSLSEQERIVGILDTFTSAIDNLKAQIAQRRKQYEYYRDQLLDLEGKEGVVMKTLGELCLIKTGCKPLEIKENGLFKYINAGTSESGYVDKSNCDGDVVTTPSRGQGGIGFVAYQFEAFWLGPLCYQIRPNEQERLSSKFLYNYLSSHNEEILKYKSEGGTPAINALDLKKIIIHLPPLEDQRRIVGILDTFEASIQNLESQLAAREQQYEYYRNKLLTFE